MYTFAHYTLSALIYNPNEGFMYCCATLAHHTYSSLKMRIIHSLGSTAYSACDNSFEKLMKITEMKRKFISFHFFTSSALNLKQISLQSGVSLVSLCCVQLNVATFIQYVSIWNSFELRLQLSYTHMNAMPTQYRIHCVPLHYKATSAK